MYVEINGRILYNIFNIAHAMRKKHKRRKTMKLSRRILSLVLAVVMAVSVFAFASCSDKIEAPKFSDDTIKIGLTGPLTGDAAVYGQAVLNGATLAVYEINEKGGLDGVKFSLEMLDDQHDATQVQSRYATLEGKKMQVSLGTVTTKPGLEYKPLAKEDNLFILTPSASGDDIPKDSPNAYQMCFADGNQGSVAANYVNGLGLTKIGIFYKSDDDYSKGIYEQFKVALSSTITTVEASFTDANDEDFSAQVNTLKDCTFIFMPIYYTPASTFMLQAQGKVADNATYYGCDGFDGIDSIKGFDITKIPQNVHMLSHFNSKATEGAAKEFVDKYTEHFGKDTLNQFGASAYDCVYAIYNALKAAKAADSSLVIDGSTSASVICEILKAQFNGGFTFSGVTGTNIKWESTGYVNKSAIAYEIKKANG